MKRQESDATALGVAFESLLDAAPDAMVVVDDQGVIRVVNRQTEAMFGYEREELIGQPIEILVPDRVAGVHPEHRTSFFTTPSVRPTGLGLELSGRRKDGTEFPVDISLSPVQRSSGRLVTAAVRDITERRREQAMFQGLLESAPDAIVVVDEKGLIRIVNRQTEVMFGYTRDELLGKEIGILVPDRVASIHPTHRSNYMRQPSARAMGAGLELSGRRKDGSEFPVDISLSPLETQEGNLLVSAAVRDISERKQAEEELRALEDLRRSDEERRRLLSGLVRAQEAERKRIAEDIHDDSIQVISAIGMRLHLLRRRIDSPETIAVVDQLEETVELATRRLRRLMFELRPRILDIEGLSATLQAYLAETAAETGLKFAIQEEITSEPSSEVRVILYRIAQEALTNVRKHAGATHVDVRITEVDDGYEVAIEDNGSGFSVEDSVMQDPVHLGVASMRERAQMAGGRWDIQSTQGRGTAVAFWLPREVVPVQRSLDDVELGSLFPDSSPPALGGVEK